MSDDDDDDDDGPDDFESASDEEETTLVVGRTSSTSETISLQTPVSRCVRESSRDPRTDLAFERARATFRSKELETLLAGGIENVKLRKLVAETVTKDAVFGNKTSEKYSLRREELYRTTLEKYLEIPRVAREILAKMDTIDGGTNNRSESSGSSNNNNRLIEYRRWARVYRRTEG